MAASGDGPVVNVDGEVERVGLTGVNWESSLMVLKFLGEKNQGFTSDAVRAINYATMMRTKFGVNVRVTNNSWG